MYVISTIPGNPKIIRSIHEVFSKKECSVGFDINMILRPGEAVFLDIPDEYRLRTLDLITLTHRKAYRQASKKWDPEPAYSRVLVLDFKTKTWKYWGAKQFPGVSFGDKLAEPRDAGTPEIEALHDWLAYTGRIFPRAVCIVNSGKGKTATSFVYSLVLDYFPNDLISKQTFIFSPGTSFANQETKTKELFGGGESYRGQYPHAVPLSTIKKKSFPLSKQGENYYLEDEKLHIVVDHRYTFSRIEVAVGDTIDTGEYNKDGHFGSPGSAKLSIDLLQQHRMLNLAKNLNVPPQGVLKASPLTTLPLSPGDEFIISSKFDPAYVMGVRIQ